MTEGEETLPKKDKGSIFWVFVHFFRWFQKVFLENPFIYSTIMVLGFITFVILRAYVQPYVLRIRILFPEIVATLLFVYGIYMLWTRKKKFVAVLTGSIVAVVAFSIYANGFEPHKYNTLYFQYRGLDKIALSDLPETRHERVHPLHAVHTASNKRIADVLHTAVPDYVKWGSGDPHFTIGVEPDFAHQRIFGSVEQIFAVPGQASRLDFSGENQVVVDFDSGEDMYFIKNLTYIARQKFSLWQYLNYSVGDVKYILNSHGEVVQCITLTKWQGIFFPRPQFGGVIIIHQGQVSLLGEFKRMFVGDGEFISAKDVAGKEWLCGQNLVPYEVSRHIADSFRFRYGYTRPLPGVHFKDIRIPDLAGDMNNQPFTTEFSFGPDDLRNKLYHYFALEPYQRKDSDKQGLAVSLLCPADGIGPVYYYEHWERNEHLIGVSAAATHVKEARKEYDWERNDVAENRPWIRTIFEKKRLLWLSTVVTKTDGDKKDFIAGSAIDVFLVDTLTAEPVEVDAGKPDTWVESVEEALK